MSRIINQILELAKLDTASPEKIAATSAAIQTQLDREAQQLLQEALRAVQSELPTINHNEQLERHGEVIASFATYETIMAAIQPLLSEHGFTVMFHTDYVGKNQGSVACILSHVGGASIQSSFPLMVTDWSDMSEAQAIASGETFAKRRALCSALNIVTKGADKNGEAATPINQDVAPKPANYDKRVTMLRACVKKGDRAKFQKAYADTELSIREWGNRYDRDTWEALKRMMVTPQSATVEANDDETEGTF